MYSALKVNGKKLYELAREGKKVERKSRKVSIRRIRITEIDLPRIRMEVECSKGTYIRTLCHDIGRSSGAAGVWNLFFAPGSAVLPWRTARKLGEVEEWVRSGRLHEILIPADRVFDRMREVRTSEPYDRFVHNGSPVLLHGLDAGTAGGDNRLLKKMRNGPPV